MSTAETIVKESEHYQKEQADPKLLEDGGFDNIIESGVFRIESPLQNQPISGGASAIKDGELRVSYDPSTDKYNQVATYFNSNPSLNGGLNYVYHREYDVQTTAFSAWVLEAISESQDTVMDWVDMGYPSTSPTITNFTAIYGSGKYKITYGIDPTAQIPSLKTTIVTSDITIEGAFSSEVDSVTSSSKVSFYKLAAQTTRIEESSISYVPSTNKLSIKIIRFDDSLTQVGVPLILKLEKLREVIK